MRPVGVVAPSSKSKPSSFRAHLKRAGGGAVAGIGQFRPVAVDAQSSMKWTFRIASIARHASGQRCSRPWWDRSRRCGGTAEVIQQS